MQLTVQSECVTNSIVSSDLGLTTVQGGVLVEMDETNSQDLES